MTAGYTPHDLAVLVPMLGRPHHVAPLLASIRATVPGCRVLFLVSPGDTEVHAAVDEATAEQVRETRLMVARRPRGDFAVKTNTGYRHTTEPLLFTGASDLEFQPGWFEAAAAHLEPGVGVVGTNDCANPRVMRGEHATHFLVTREYADRFGVIDQPGAIFCELYPHEMVDDELIATARKRQAYRWAGESHVRHLHPTWFPNIPMDATYAAQTRRLRAGRPIFQRRRRLWA